MRSPIESTASKEWSINQRRRDKADSDSRCSCPKAVTTMDPKSQSKTSPRTSSAGQAASAASQPPTQTSPTPRATRAASDEGDRRGNEPAGQGPDRRQSVIDRRLGLDRRIQPAETAG